MYVCKKRIYPAGILEESEDNKAEQSVRKSGRIVTWDIMLRLMDRQVRVRVR